VADGETPLHVLTEQRWDILFANELTSIHVQPGTIIDAGKVGNRHQGSLKMRFDPAEYLNTWTPEAVKTILNTTASQLRMVLWRQH
jgi:hypothetical protein